MSKPTTEAAEAKRQGLQAVKCLSKLETALSQSEALPMMDRLQLSTMAASLQFGIAGLNGRIQNVYKEFSKVA